MRLLLSSVALRCFFRSWKCCILRCASSDLITVHDNSHYLSFRKFSFVCIELSYFPRRFSWMNVQKHCYMHTDPNYKCSFVKLRLGMMAECPLSGINLHPASSHNQVFNQGCLITRDVPNFIFLSEFRYLNRAYHLIPIVDLVLVHLNK